MTAGSFINEVCSLDSSSVHARWSLPGPDDWIFRGHFPKKPITPGVLILSAVEEATGLLEPDGSGLLGELRNTRFRTQTGPADVLDIRVRRTDDDWVSATVEMGPETVCTLKARLSEAPSGEYPAGDIDQVNVAALAATFRPDPTVLRQHPPFRFVDKVTAAAPLQFATGSWSADPSHPLFKGRTGVRARVPGPVLFEIMGQTLSTCAYGTEMAGSRLLIITSVRRGTFSGAVRPGDTVVSSGTFDTVDETGVIARFSATVAGRPVASAICSGFWLPDH